MSLGLYLHIPYCFSKCRYCDFYSAPGQRGVPRAYVDALLRELSRFAPDAPLRPDTLYFGGGTPSFYGEKRLRELLSAVKKRFEVAGNAEISLEANPDSVDKKSMVRLRRAGVNRVSLGMQSAHDDELEALHRAHTWQQTRQAVNDISAASARLDRTVNEVMSLLDFLRTEEDPRLYPLDLCQLLQQVAAQADMVQAQLGVELTLDYGGWTACRVMADRNDAELLCLHLLSNALRACSAGGKVRLMLRRSESFWQLTVMDNGCGLPEAGEDAWLENRRCFLGGAKLGLLLCRECCRRMGWGLRVERAPEKGTQAVVTIPLCTDRITEPTVELHTGGDTAQAQQHQYQLRNMLVRELRTMPERGDPDEL